MVVLYVLHVYEHNLITLYFLAIEFVRIYEQSLHVLLSIICNI